jgi:hypothetical protein
VKQHHVIPPERKRQFDLIALASERTLRWAHLQGIALEHIEPVVPFVETDFSLGAWLFFDTEGRVKQYSSDGTADRTVAQFRTSLAEAGYPPEWLLLIECYFGSREVVDRDYRGLYCNFVR